MITILTENTHVDSFFDWILTENRVFYSVFGNFEWQKNENNGM